MDKRTVIAFVLIGLIVVLMPYYMRWIYGDEPHTPVQTPTPPGVSRETLDAPSDVPSVTEAPERQQPPEVELSTLPATTEFEPRDVVIDTDFYRAVISTRGGVLTSWKLKQHFDTEGNWLELMKRNRSGLGMAIGDHALDLVEFTPDCHGIALTGDRQDVLVLRAQGPFGPVEKRLRFQGNRYRVELEVKATGLPRSDNIILKWEGALAETEEIAPSSFYESHYEQIVTYAGGVMEVWDVARLDKKEQPPSGHITWVGIRNKYFLAGLIPDSGRFEVRMSGNMEEYSFRPPAYDYQVQIKSEDPEDVLRFGIFIGPISYNILREQNRDLDGVYRELDFDEFVDYGPSFLRTILKPVTILILKAFLAMNQVVPNYGVVIILFSLLVKIVVFPLTHKSMESIARMQKMQPKMAEIRERYGKDSQKMNQAMMKLYRDEKINPLGGCLPMVLQMPILFSLFSVFRGTIEFRQAGFMLWIDDLSRPDTISLGSFDLHVLPLLMGISMFIQQKMTMKDPKQAALVYIMPIFLTYIFWSMSSGLVFYYTLYNVLTLAQQYIMEKTKKVMGTQ